MRSTTSLTWAGLLLAASSASALATPAATTFNSNLRSGPGVDNPVVAIIPAGAAIDVGRCAGSWCRVSAQGAEGFLSRSLIAMGAPGSPIAVLPPVAVAEPGASTAYDQSGDYGANYAYSDGWGPGVGVGVLPGGYYGGRGLGYGGRLGYGYGGRFGYGGFRGAGIDRAGMYGGAGFRGAGMHRAGMHGGGFHGAGGMGRGGGRR